MRTPATPLQPAPAPSARRTNATALRRGTRATTPLTGRPPSRWDYLSGVQQLGVELALAVVLLGAAWLHTHGYAAAVTTAAVGAACAAVGCAGWAATGALVMWRHRHQVVEPLAQALAPLVARHELEAPRWLDVPRNYAEPGAPPVTVHLPRGWRSLEGERAQVEAIVASRLGLPDLAYSWQVAGRRPRVVVRPRHHPPERVNFADPEVRALVDAAAEHAPVLGVASRGEVVAVDLDHASPHLLVASSTGGGKSTILRGVFAQLLAHGAVGSIVDYKRHSLRPFRGIAGVDYARDLQECHEVLCAAGVELERRNRLVDEHEGDGDPVLDLPRHVVLIDEANMTLQRLKRWWSKVRAKDDPKDSPALEALADLVFAGRAVRMNCIIVAQSATVHALGGGPEIRENMGTRVLLRYSANAWRMLTEVTPIPPSVRHAGRAQVIYDGAAHATQMLWIDEGDARALALSAPRPVDHPGSPAVELWRSGAGHPGDGPGATVALHVVPDPGEALVSLRQAVEAGTVPVTLLAARSARARDPEWPAPAGRNGTAELYRPADLARWARNRPRARPVEVEL